MNLLLVGCGKMGSALLERWQVDALFERIVVVEPSSSAVSGSTLFVVDAAQIPQGFTPDVVLIAVKPQVLADILPAYQRFVSHGALFVSIVAGKPISFFENLLGHQAKIVRTMPNTPASIGKGITVATMNPHVTQDECKVAERLLTAAGEVLWVEDEAMLNPVTALSGSGPAYVFLLIEVLTQAGIDVGLQPDMAARLARQTVIGSAALAECSADVSASVLRENVTSPNGTTAAALTVLMDGRLQSLFTQALLAATTRAEELSH